LLRLLEGRLFLRQELDQVYREQAPELVKDDIPIEDLIERRANSLRESPFFKEVMVRTYPWTVRYTTDEHLGLLNTYSDHLGLQEDRRHRLYQAIAEVLDQHGGWIERPYLATVYMAQRTSYASSGG